MSDLIEKVGEPKTLVQKTVRFLRRHGSYNRGMEAGFSPGQADELVARGCAIQVHPPVEREPLHGRVVRKG